MTQLNKSVYLVLTPERNRYYPEQVRGFTITDMRKGKPKLNGGQVAVKVQLTIDSSVFEDYIPVVSAVLHGTDLLLPEVTVIEPDPAAVE